MPEIEQNPSRRPKTVPSPEVAVFNRAPSTFDWTELKAFRQRNHLFRYHFEESAISTVRNIENGRYPDLQTQKNIYFDVMKYVYDPFTRQLRSFLIQQLQDESDPETVALKEEFSQRELAFEEARWRTTVSKHGLGESIRQLILNEGITQLDFVKQLDHPTINSHFLKNVIAEKYKPRLLNLNSILEASLLATFGEDNAVMQILRLKTIRETPLTKEKLEKSRYGSVLTYCWTAMGYMQEELARVVGIGESTITDLKWKARAQFKNRSQQLIHQLLGIDEANPLYQVMQAKEYSFYTPLSESQFSDICKGKFIFCPPGGFTDPAVIPKEDQTFLTKIQTEKLDIADIMMLWITKHGISQKAFAKKAKRTVNRISEIKNKNYQPSDLGTFKIAQTFGYDIHHPITQYMLKQLRDKQRTT